MLDFYDIDAMDDLEDDIDDPEPELTDDDYALPREYGIDFTTGQLTGEVVEGSEAVAVWAWFALQTMRYEYFAYSWDYGSELYDLIGTVYSKEYTDALAEMYVRECLLVNEDILDITDFSCTLRDNRRDLILQFTLVTAYGEEDMSVNV